MKNLFTIILLVMLSWTLAQAMEEGQNTDRKKLNYQFVENKGQFDAGEEVLFVGQKLNQKVYVRKDGLSFLFRDSEGKYRRVDMELIGCNEETRAFSLDETGSHCNYYKNGKSFEKIPVKRAVMLHNIYDKIKLVIYTNQEGDLEYDFAVSKGGDPSDIKYRFVNHDGIRLNDDGSMTIENSFGDLRKCKPYSYYSGEIKNEIASKYELSEDEIVSFEVSDYDKNKILIIDPIVLDWATFYGGSGLDEAYSVASDAEGCTYFCGETGSSDFVATVNQTSIGGGNDAFIVKLNSDGSTAWSTYYGGSSDDGARGLDIDEDGNVWITGYTTSTDLNVNLGQINLGGGKDAFIARFDDDGTFNWGTYYGGSSDDIAYELKVIDNDYSLITGSTESTDINITTNQTDFGGMRDGFLAAFTPLGNLQWATYFGGSGDDESYGIDVNSVGEIYMAGKTFSDDLNVSVNQTTKGGNYDGFLAKFSGSGNTQWATYFGGEYVDGAYGITTDGDRIYITGETFSQDFYADVGQTDLASTYFPDAFIARFDEDGSTVWSTLYGGYSHEWTRGIAADSSGNIYIVGGTTSKDLPRNAYRTFSSSNEGFVAKFSENGIYEWASYLGGSDAEDSPEDVLATDEDMVLIAGYTKSTDMETTVNQTTHEGNSDAFIVWLKKETGENLTIDPIVGNPFCMGEEIEIEFETHDSFDSGNIFTAELSDSDGNFNNPTEIGSLQSQSGDVINATIPAGIETATGYRIRIISSSPATEDIDNGADLQIGDTPDGNITGSIGNICAGEEVKYQAAGVDDFSAVRWEANGGSIIGEDNQEEVTVSWKTGDDQSIILIITDVWTGCKKIAERDINLLPSPSAALTGPDAVCSQSSTTYSVEQQDDVIQTWFIDGGYVSGSNSAPEVRIFWMAPGNGTITIQREDTLTGCTREIIKAVPIHELPMVEIQPYSTGTICAGTSASFSANYDPEKYSVMWGAPGGEIVGPADEEDFAAVFDEPGSHTITLRKTNLATNCSSEAYYEVDIGPVPDPELVQLHPAVCAFSETEFAASKSQYQRTFEWHVAGGEIKGFGNTQQITVEWGEAGIGQVKLIETIVESGCSDSAEYEIVIHEAPVAEITSGEFDVCANMAKTYTTSFEEGVAIEWSADNGTIVGPSDEATVEVVWDDNIKGWLILEKFIESGNCSDSTSKRVSIKSPPMVTLDAFSEVCENDAKFELTGGSPEGGEYSGEGIDNNIFDPAAAGAGAHDILYTYTDARGCSGTATRTIEVLPAPEKPGITRQGDVLISDADQNNQWYMDGEPIAGATGKEYSPDEDGIYQVEVTAENGCTAISDEYDFSVGVFEISKRTNVFEVYPNPANEIINIRFNRNFNSPLDICLVDLLGKTLGCVARPSATAGDIVEIPASGANNGIYLLRVISGGDIYFMKIMIKH